jgi:L,D-transpeptidase YcbB
MFQYTLNHRPTALFRRPTAGIAVLGCLLMALPATAGQVAEPPPVAPVVPPATQAERLAQIDPAPRSARERAAIATSLARWEKLAPLPAGRFLLINIPAYRMDLFDGPARLASWRVIVGKARTPTPEFRAEAKGVILNPWWEVPASIVRESVGALLARNPKSAAAKGYVKQGARYRQAPGPDNQLGRMKLDFPNAQSIGIHDTPSKSLFDREQRAFSHGCIRVDDPMGLAATLLGPPSSRDSLQTFVDTSRETNTIPFPQPIPVIVTYLPAEVGDDGTLVVHEDVYRKANQALALRATGPSECLSE